MLGVTPADPDIVDEYWRSRMAHPATQHLLHNLDPDKDEPTYG